MSKPKTRDDILAEIARELRGIRCALAVLGRLALYEVEYGTYGRKVMACLLDRALDGLDIPTERP